MTLLVRTKGEYKMFTKKEKEPTVLESYIKAMKDDLNEQDPSSEKCTKIVENLEKVYEVYDKYERPKPKLEVTGDTVLKCGFWAAGLIAGFLFDTEHIAKSRTGWGIWKSMKP